MLLCLWTAFLSNRCAATEVSLVTYESIKAGIVLRLNLENCLEKSDRYLDVIHSQHWGQRTLEGRAAH